MSPDGRVHYKRETIEKKPPWCCGLESASSRRERALSKNRTPPTTASRYARVVVPSETGSDAKGVGQGAVLAPPPVRTETAVRELLSGGRCIRPGTARTPRCLDARAGAGGHPGDVSDSFQSSFITS